MEMCFLFWKAKHVGNYVSPSLNTGIPTSPDQKKKKTTNARFPLPPHRELPLPPTPIASACHRRPLAGPLAAPSPHPSPRAPPAPRPAPHTAFPPASPPRHRRPPRRPGPRASSSSAAGRAPPLRWPARHRPRPPPLRRTARHRPLPSSPADVPSSPPAAPLLCTFTACSGNGNRGRVQGNKLGENKEYTRRGREVTASKPMTRALLHAMNATRDIKKRVPWVVGVEVDPNGGPSVQEADMRLYHSRNRGAGEEAGKIELLQAFQAVEAVVQRFFFMYQQVIAAVCATVEERVQ